ncbi:MarR family winged helix-turn-helix transcriptional regulator [Kribbella sp. NPDC049174]|uniref:MarR family winged helix-turn-helix transcriptional regulator n=1 Tax=Kribbella sp. NPDC049174 TaxID=3364112 RepID=UPI0037161C70
MKTAEELRYLILAIQREGNRLLAAELRPLGLTPSQAEVLRVLGDHGPLTLSALGGLLVCETGNSPSRLVDRLVAQGLIQRDTDPNDRRYLALSLTVEGRQLSSRVATAEDVLHQAIDDLVAGQAVDQTINTLRVLAEAFPAGEALARRRTGGNDGTSDADHPGGS